MRWVKQIINYWCSDITKGQHLGNGIYTAILDTGVSDHPDLSGRISAFQDFTSSSSKCRDDSGHGTHVAGILAGNGRLSRGIYAGIAPQSEIFVGKILDREGNGNVENVLRGIDWVKQLSRKHPIRIVNISVGTQPDLAESQKQLLLDAVDDLWDMGLVVVVSAGNYGPQAGSVAVPGNSRKVITVGVPDTLPDSRPCRTAHTPSISKSAYRMLPPVQRQAKNLNYSGRGPTKDCVVKPDVFAPGTGIISCNSRFSSPGERPYTMKSGTSMAAPVVSGAIACLLSKYPDMTNVEVKLKLRETCEKFPGTESGWGMLNVAQLMKV